MKTQIKRNPLRKTYFHLYVFVITLLFFIICLNIVYAGERLEVAVSKANIRSGSVTKYRILFTVEKGVAFKVLKQKASWIHIQHADGDKG
jgi:uncharacterized protein YgiM (DUF1202 family)